MDYTRIAERIGEVWDWYHAYENIVDEINFKASLAGHKDKMVSLKPNHFNDFEESTFDKLIEKWGVEREKLQKEYHQILLIDSDDYK